MNHSSLSTKEILELVASGSLTSEQAEILMKENKEIQNVNLKLSEKGCISFYGIRKFPISLYPKELDLILKRLVKEPVYTDFFNDFLKNHQIDMNKKL